MTKEEPKIVTVNVESATGEDLGTVSYIPLPNVDYTPKQETLEEAAKKYVKSLNLKVNVDEYKEYAIIDFIAGAKWQQERMYSEEDLRNAYRWGTTVNHGTKEHFNEWFEQFKKKV